MPCKNCEKLEIEIEQLQCQLSGCGVAAFGYIKDNQEIKEEDYGWSVSYQDVKDLRIKYNNLLKKVEEMAEVCGFQLEINYEMKGK